MKYSYLTHVNCFFDALSLPGDIRMVFEFDTATTVKAAMYLMFNGLNAFPIPIHCSGVLWI